MGTTPSKLPHLKLGKLKSVRHRLVQRYEHEPFVSCLSGLYGCQWKHNQRTRAQNGHCCCSKLECGSFALIVLTFIVTLVFLYFWGKAQNDYNDFDWFNFGNLGFWFPWSMVLLILAVCLFTYVAVLLIGIVVTLILSVVATSVLTDLWRKEWLTVVLSFQVTAPYLHIGGIALMTLLSWPIAFHVFRINLRVRRMAIVVLYIAVLMTLYLVPLGIRSPCIKERNSLVPAPALIGHRGAPMMAPENTYMSFEKAVAAGSDGFETDVTISYDGVPFLMHDKNLRRTTNVKEIFPNWTDVSSAMFTWRELKSLNAGSWFLSQDPFGTASSLSSYERMQVQNQSVCTLKSFLDLAAHHGKLVIFDLYRPPKGHPYRDAWISRTLEVIQNESSIHSSQLRNIVKLNIHYSSMSEKDIRNYAAANISTNLYVISEPWLFSLAWCVSARSVTTNAVHILKNLQRPLLLMTPDEYSLVWALTDLTSLILVLIIFVFHWWRERGLALCVGNISALENGSVHTIQDRDK